MKSLEIRERTYGVRHVETAQSLFHLGSVARANRDLPRAISLHSDAIEIVKEMTGSESVEVSMLMNTLADDYIIDCDYKRSLKFQNEALKIIDEKFGEMHPEVIFINLSLAKLSLGTQDYTKALKFALKAKSIVKNLFDDPGHHLLGHCNYCCAEIYLEQKKIKEGSKLLLKAKSIYAAIYGPIHENVAK